MRNPGRSADDVAERENVQHRGTEVTKQTQRRQNQAAETGPEQRHDTQPEGRAWGSPGWSGMRNPGGIAGDMDLLCERETEFREGAFPNAVWERGEKEERDRERKNRTAADARRLAPQRGERREWRVEQRDAEPGEKRRRRGRKRRDQHRGTGHKANTEETMED
jgi:hypothetical protein